LAALRNQKGISLHQIAEATKIGVRYLEAIEGGQFASLPGGVASRVPGWETPAGAPNAPAGPPVRPGKCAVRLWILTV
jgi:hypothetical protein